MANPYTERLATLNDKRVSSNVRQLSDMVGLPTRRPGAGGQLTSPSGVPVGAAPLPQEPQEDQSYKDTTFYNNFDHHRQNDPHFDSLSGEMTKLATGLRKQVEAGYMPPQIAQENLKQFITDSFHRRGQAEPYLQRQNAQKAQEADTQNRSGALLNQIAQEAVMNPHPDSPMAKPDGNPAVQNLSAPDQSGPQLSIGGAQSKPIGGAQSTDTGASLNVGMSF